MRLSGEERLFFEREGYLVRHGQFGAAEVDDLRQVVEDATARVVAHANRPEARPENQMADGHRIQFSSKAAIQWEWQEGSQAIRVMEPFTHIDERFEAMWADPRLAEPMKDMLGADDVGPFTSKLNMKRAQEGSEFPYHQDYPYWYAVNPDHAGDLATVVVFLDAATAENGAIRVLPGSHAQGPAVRDKNAADQFLADPEALDRSGEIPVEVAAGSLVFFGSLLVHRSSPNTSARDRRALLYTFQPGGRRRMQEQEWKAERVNDLP
jgi:ectoine hydroxylase